MVFFTLLITIYVGPLINVPRRVWYRDVAVGLLNKNITVGQLGFNVKVGGKFIMYFQWQGRKRANILYWNRVIKSQRMPAFRGAPTSSTFRKSAFCRPLS